MTHIRYAIRYGGDLYVSAYPSTTFVASPFDASLYGRPDEAATELKRISAPGGGTVPDPTKLAIVRLGAVVGGPAAELLDHLAAGGGINHTHHCCKFGCGTVLVCAVTPGACGADVAWQCPTCELKQRDRTLGRISPEPRQPRPLTCAMPTPATVGGTGHVMYCELAPGHPGPHEALHDNGVPGIRW